MKIEKAKDLGFTHLGIMYDTLCYLKYDEENDIYLVKGTNMVRHAFIRFMIWIQCNIYDPHGAFMIEEIEEL